MYDLEDETQEKVKHIIPFYALRGSRSLSNFHDVDDEDDLSTGKEKFARVRVRKTKTAIEDDHKQ
jgi:hypothetical protein